MERSSFFNAMLAGNTYDRIYKAEDFARYFASFIGNGVYANPANNLQVVAVDNNMNVRVRAGRAWINGYFYENTDELQFTLTPADGVLHRIDRMVVRLDLINREIVTALKRGTPASIPVAPALERNDDIYEIALGDIKISAGTIRIIQSDITDQRYVTDLCGIVSGIVNQIDMTGLFSQFEDEFTRWFDDIKGKLGADVAGDLQLQINNLEQSINAELAKYLLLTGGTVTGDLNVTGNLQNNGDQVWHEGNFNPNDKYDKTGGVLSGNVTLDGSSRSYQIMAAGGTHDVVKINDNNGEVQLGSENFKATLMANNDPKWSNGVNEYEIWNENNMPVQSGIWSPQFTASNGGTVTYNSRDGRYFRIGNMVIISFNLIAVNPVNFNGQLNVINLPFVNTMGVHVGCSLFAIRGFNVGSEASNRQICAYVRPNESRIVFNYSDTTAVASNIAVLEHSHLLQNNQIEISATVTFKIN